MFIVWYACTRYLQLRRSGFFPNVTMVFILVALTIGCNFIPPVLSAELRSPFSRCLIMGCFLGWRLSVSVWRFILKQI
ncbi:hypothetical protein Tsubulata_026403 [Turnera subulata]|uniref:Uncharacterized protein n=1 Tax=Turnera subulata TaxID=218843 RepID=A0A9Q0J4C0_9ROSI|nr:hypothetical protein Tsubulata_026403 [Turnera subulata]